MYVYHLSETYKSITKIIDAFDVVGVRIRIHCVHPDDCANIDRVTDVIMVDGLVLHMMWQSVETSSIDSKSEA